jgi:hypothetical protein
MEKLLAKLVVKNKLWSLEKSNNHIGCIQSVDNGVILVSDQKKERFSSLKSLGDKYNIEFDSSKQKSNKSTNQVYDFPVDCKPYNIVYDLKRKLPLYTTRSDSKSYYCAGYYSIFINDIWTIQFCPKSIVLSRNKFNGPYHQEIDAKNSVTLSQSE